MTLVCVEESGAGQAAVAEHAGQVGQPPALVLRDRVIGAHQFVCFLVGEDIAAGLAGVGRLAVETLEKERDRYIERRRDILHAAGAYPVRPGLVFVDLLKLDADPIAKLLLSHSRQATALAYPLPDMNIY